MPVLSSVLFVMYLGSDNCPRNGSSDSLGVLCISMLQYSVLRAFYYLHNYTDAIDSSEIISRYEYVSNPK